MKNRKLNYLIVEWLKQKTVRQLYFSSREQRKYLEGNRYSDKRKESFSVQQFSKENPE